MADTILYLRPCNPNAIEVLNIPANKKYVEAVAPPPKPHDIPLLEIPEHAPTVHLSPYHYSPPGDGGGSRESTPGLDAFSPKVLKIGFKSPQKSPAQGFQFGSGSDSDVQVSYPDNEEEVYFRIHYNFDSGALLISGINKTSVGAAPLQKHESLLLMAGTIIFCGVFAFSVQFPDLSSCAEEHERNFVEHAAKAGFPDAQYTATSLTELPPIGAKHRSVALLGKGNFGEVHKAMRNEGGAAFAIKILSGEGDGMEEVNKMRRLYHENIIKFELAFKIPNGQTCIAMELAVSDLKTQLKARRSGTRPSHLSMECIQSIGRQALSGLAYLHSEKIIHRDLKLENILVTKWDTQTDIPTIKLADFGLAAIGSERQTFCGTEDYLAPEVIEAQQMIQDLKEQQRKGMETVPLSRVGRYNNKVDIYAMGKILEELFLKRSSRRPPWRESPLPESAFRLIDRMMQRSPYERPSAVDCLKDPWLAITNNIDSQPAQKRGRSPSPLMSSSTSSVGKPPRKAIRKVSGNPFSNGAGLMNAVRPNEESDHWNASSQALRGALTPHDEEMTDGSPVAEGRTQQPWKDGRLSHTSDGHSNPVIIDSPAAADEYINPAFLNNNPVLHEASPSIGKLERELLLALRAEGEGTDVGLIRKELARLHIANIMREPESYTTPGLLFGHDGWIGRSWSEEQSPKLPSPSFLGKVYFRERDPAETLGPMPSIRLNDGVITDQLESVTQPSVTSKGSHSNLNSGIGKGVTYPIEFDDITAGISF
ncbi:MAG: hypothetical protein Q9217_006083 [Psora testacea]